MGAGCAFHSIECISPCVLRCSFEFDLQFCLLVRSSLSVHSGSLVFDEISFVDYFCVRISNCRKYNFDLFLGTLKTMTTPIRRLFLELNTKISLQNL